MHKMNELKIIDIECTDNRKMSGIEELAANIAAVGLIQPLALKDEGNGRYRVVAGRRRFRALQRLGWEKLQGSQYVICDADPELAAFCENFHRANLTLAEEVGQFHQLKADKLTIRELASLLGKSPDYVALRLNLTNLSTSWQEVLSHPEDYPQWTPAKLELIARQTEKIQEDRAYWRERTMSVKEINEALAGDNAFLKSAPFDTTACRECPKRSGAAELLFPDLAGKGDTCLDRKCFEKKLLKCVLAEIESIRERLKADPDAEPFYLFFDNLSWGTEAYKQFNKFSSSVYFAFEKKGKKDYNAYCVWGPRAGTYFRVKPKHSQISPINARNTESSVTGGTAEKKVKTLADREAELLAKRNKLAMLKMIELLGDSEAALRKLQQSRADCFQDTVLALAYQFGTTSGIIGNSIANGFEQASTKMRGNLEAYLEHAWRCVAVTIMFRLREITRLTLDRIDDRTARAFCEILNWDYDAEFFRPAAEEIQPGKALLAARKAGEVEKQG